MNVVYNRQCHLLVLVTVVVVTLRTTVVLYSHNYHPLALNSGELRRPNLKSESQWATKSMHSILPAKSYMLALHYAEQLTMSTWHYIQFLNLVGGWNFTGVEPYIHNSRMFGVHTNPSELFVKYSVLLNVSILNNDLSRCLNRTNDHEKGRPVLFEPMKEFFNRSYRNISIVYFVRHMFVLSKDIHKAMDGGVKFDKEPIIDCTATARETGLSESVEGKLNDELMTHNLSTETYDNHTLDQLQFRVVQAFCVNKTVVTLVQLMDYIDQHIKHKCGTQERRSTSVVFVSWQGQYTRKFKDRPTMDRCSAKIVHSDTVKRIAERFIESLGLRKNSFLSIHVRFEKIFESSKRNDSEFFYQCVMKRLNTLVSNMRLQHNMSTNATLLFHDYDSVYGSDSCHYEGKWASKSKCVQKSNELLSMAAISSNSFDPVMFDMPANSGFVSLVESECLDLGRALITLGGGSYQGLLKTQFLRSHTDSGSVHSVNTKVDFLANGTAVCQ